MPTILRRRREKDKMSEDAPPSSVMKHISAIAVPGMYLYYKYNEFKKQRIEDMKRKVTERELDHLNQKIVSHFLFNYILSGLLREIF